MKIQLRITQVRNDIQIKNNEITCSQNTDGLNNNLLVSMNLWVFSPLIFPFLRDAFETFYSENKKDENAELYLPYVINQLIQNGEISVTIADTDSSWFGLTFAEDLTPSVKKLKSLISQGLYPFKLTTDG